LKILFAFFSELPKPELALTRSSWLFNDSCDPALHFWRRVVAAPPNWTDEGLALPRFSVDWQEGVEDCADSVQVGMSNRYPGGAPGGVLSTGKMQEPVFFAERPELLVALLISPALRANEALVVSGARQFGAGAGIGEGLRAVAGGASPSQRDRAATQDLMQVDALDYRDPQTVDEFSRAAVDRELLKLYAGHSGATLRSPLTARKKLAASGNWCCDAFGGDPQLKAVLQLIAGGGARLDTLQLYPNAYPFMRTNKSELPPLHLPQRVSTVGGLYRALLAFIDMPGSSASKRGQLFEYLASVTAFDPSAEEVIVIFQ